MPNSSSAGNTPPTRDGVDILAVGHAPILQINRRLYRAIAKKGWRVELVIPTSLPRSWGVSPIQPDHADDPRIHRLGVNGSNTRYWSFAGLVALLEARRPRIVYLENEPDSLMALQIGRWCRRNRAYLVVSSNENDIPPVFAALRERGLKPALRSLRTRAWSVLARRYVAHVVALTSGGREAMETIGFRGAVTVAPLGFDENLFYPDDGRRQEIRRKLNLKHPTVAYFGRLSPQKGIHLIIDALSGIKELSWHLLLDDFSDAVGDYPSSLGQRLIERGIGDRTSFFEASHEEIVDYMRAADIVVLPSTTREQYGRVVGEAMACGRSVVVSDLGALPELVGSAGVKSPPGDVPKLREILADLIVDAPRRRELGVLAVDRARDFLSMKQQVAILDRLFSDLRERGRSDGPQDLG